ncbi:MAG: twin-arginine translocation signal domain-containing protein [Acidobacteria bacterium]|nr:twin-arginine translocation signal domain-containing protein [Acidobacteriota bacterium]
MKQDTNRRDFLKILGATTAGLAVGSQGVFGQARRERRLFQISGRIYL